VRSASIARVATIAATALFLYATAWAWPHRHSQKAYVRFIADSTIIRGTWGQNEDTYLVKLHFHLNDELLLARLIDEYRPFDPPLSIDMLTSTVGTDLRIRRDPLCDIPYGQMQLRTAPGGPMAILHERLGYQPQLQRTPTLDESLPCYRTVRPLVRMLIFE
jgi:hypothetical protein